MILITHIRITNAKRSPWVEVDYRVSTPLELEQMRLSFKKKYQGRIVDFAYKVK